MKKRKRPRTKAEIIHYTMSRIGSKDTGIEIAFRKALWHSGIRYRKNYKKLPGKPDIAITKHKIAVFCDGEFWHGKDWQHKKNGFHSNSAYWVAKIERNIERDTKTDRQLECLGWTVLRFWGDDIKKNLADCVNDVTEAIIQAQVDFGNFAGYCGTEAVDNGEELTAAEKTPEYR